MAKLIKVRKPKLRVTKKGIKVRAPSARIGGKIGLHFSKRGVSASIRTPKRTRNTGKLGSSKKHIVSSLIYIEDKLQFREEYLKQFGKNFEINNDS